MATEKRLIDANAFVEWMKSHYCQHCNSCEGLLCGACTFSTFMTHIETAPTVDAVEVVHGRWVGLEPEIGLFACSECNHRILRAECNYCPNCGAKMDGGVDDA